MARVESYTQEYIDGVIATLSQQIASMNIAVNGKATPTDIADALDALVGTAPATLDTLGEISDAFQDNPQIIAQMLSSIGLRVTTAVYDAHVADTAAHGATSSPTANTIARRDAAGKLRSTTPATADGSDFTTTKGYVDPRVGRFMGDWVTGTQYYAGDLVLNAGRFYRALLTSNTTVAPTHTTAGANTTQWALVAVSLPTSSPIIGVGGLTMSGRLLGSTTQNPAGQQAGDLIALVVLP